MVQLNYLLTIALVTYMFEVCTDPMRLIQAWVKLYDTSDFTNNSTNWNTAYANSITSASFDDSNGIITLTQQDSGTVTVDIDGRFLTSETSHADVVVDGDFTSAGLMKRGA